MFIIDAFLAGLGLDNRGAVVLDQDQARGDLEHSEIRYWREAARDYERAYNEIGAITAAREASLRSSIAHLREKLETLRPYLVAAAKGSSLQAKGDLAALDAVLRITKP